MVKQRSLREMDELDPEHWSGEFSDGRSYVCAGCNTMVSEGKAVVILVDDEVDLERYYHPSCYVLAHRHTDLADLLLHRERV